MLLLVFIIEMSLSSPQNNLVINIGGIHNKFDIEVKIVPQDATNDICGDIVSCMTQVCIVVDGRPASVP